MTYPTEPKPVEDKSQQQINAERRRKREAIVGKRWKPLVIDYPDPIRLHAQFEDGYQRGHDIGYAKGKREGESDGAAKWFVVGALVGGIAVAWFIALIN
jgi:flagellar biosynthesis/type III secretory pathway protein FliH